MSEGAERRVAGRVKVDLPVTYRLDDGPEHPATVDNISRSGLLLVAGEAIRDGQRLLITFEDARRRRFTVVGAVVRSSPMGRLGVSFVHIEDATLEYVRDVLGVP